MYISGIFSCDMSEVDQCGPVGDMTNMCCNQAPRDGYGCTLTKGHGGLHKAGTSMTSWAAVWDDDRSTDPIMPNRKKQDFFESIGL